ncbi:7TM diverse intracellular signaling domain-containing protein [Mucilaginibacter calamicampi]|uniref:histidine kinase n=1 Tax=Mucilaginibacter calamicampi TaxID=1302352 RepID=A0ABW2YZX2_9SPHI
MIKRIIAFFFTLAVFAANALAQAPVVFNGGDNVVIGEHVSILEDTANNLTVESVKNHPGFSASTSQVPNLQLSKSSFWLKFTVTNKSDADHLLLWAEYPMLNTCDFYYPVNGVYKVKNFSDRKIFAERKYKHQDFVIDIDLAKDSTATYYLKVASTEQIILPLILGTPQKVAESTLTKNLLWGILMGLLIVMVLYNFFVFISTRDVSYLYYVLYTLFIGLTQASLSGYTYHYLFSNSPLLYSKVLIVFPGLAGISAVLFVTSFLHTKQRTPKLHKVFPIVALLYAVAIFLRLFGFDHASYRMIDISALSVTISIYAAAIITSIQGYRPAKFFLVAWTIFLIGLVLFVLRNLGVLPYNGYTSYTMQVGTAFEVTLLSLALADRINIFKAEKERSQQETLEALKENERIVREQNIVLEAKVTERTHELNESLENLKEAQSQLVEAEKMASLGQLTAGIAHEINNPINFVTANINPLKRDLDMVLDAINVIEEIGLSEASSTEKQKKIADYKEELDFDYLLVEMNHLIKGIHEGASRTAEIVKGLRIFSRLDEDDLKRADLNEGLESTMIIANNLIGNNVKIIKEYGELPLVECYAGKLNQVFLNIISNAAYAIEKKFEGSEGGALKLETYIDGDNAIIKISDNGIGMSDETMRKVFEPFFTTKDVGEGTGLGMSIAYNTIKKHHGHLLVKSEVGKGSEFTMQIPVIFDASGQV